MAMSRNPLITNYFKKTHQTPKKRPFPGDGSEDSRERIRRKSPLVEPDGRHSAPSACSAPSSSSQASTQNPTDEESPLLSQSLPPSQRTLPNPIAPTASLYENVESSVLASPLFTSLPTLEDTRGVERPEVDDSELARPESNLSREDLHQAPLSTQDEQNEVATRPCVTVALQPALTSSQRIIRDGETMIRNSDDESDDSLEDIDDWLTRSRPLEVLAPQPEPQLPYPDFEAHETRSRTRESARAKRGYTQHSSALPAKSKRYKFSLETLNKERQRDDASKEAIARAEAMLDSYNQRTLSSEKTETLHADLIETVMQDHKEDNNISKLKSAIQRTEALQHGKSWSFFDGNADGPLFEHAEFPVVDDERLQGMFSKPVSRQQMFLGGYAGEYASRRGLPDEMLLWITDAVCTESRDDLRHAYTSTLQDATEHFSPLLTPEYMNMLFRKLGANPSALEVDKPVMPRATLSENVEVTSRHNLLSMIMLLGSVASDLYSGSRIHLLNILSRLAIDNSLIKNCRAIRAIEKAFTNLVESISEEHFERDLQSVSTSILHTIRDSALRLQLLQMLPAWPPRLILLRQRLALAFFFQDPRYLSKRPETLVDIKSITQRLQSSQYRISNATDFADLAASIGILSIGIDCGNPPPSPTVKAEEISFNKDVDSLALRINSMFNEIIDTGASHMKRTESKEVLEGFQRRLEYAIRTKPKPKKSVFGAAKVTPLDEIWEREKRSGVVDTPVSLEIV